MKMKKTNFLKIDMVFLSEKIGVLVGRNLTSYVTEDGGETWTKYVHGGGEGFNNIYCKNENEVGSLPRVQMVGSLPEKIGWHLCKQIRW